MLLSLTPYPAPAPGGTYASSTSTANWLFNRAQLSTQQDIINQTTHTRDNARQQEFHFGQSALFQDPSHRDMMWAIDQNVGSYDSSLGGVGLSPSKVDLENQLMRMPTNNQRQPAARSEAAHSVNTRLFPTVPYLGRGSVDPTLEFRLQIGVQRPFPKRRPNLPDITTASELYDAFSREAMTLADANAAWAAELEHAPTATSSFTSLRGFQPTHTFEEQTNGMERFGINTRLGKYR